MKWSHSQSRRVNHKVVINVPPCPQEEMLMGGKKALNTNHSWFLLESLILPASKIMIWFYHHQRIHSQKRCPLSCGRRIPGVPVHRNLTSSTWGGRWDSGAVWQLWGHALGSLTLSLGKPQCSHLLWLLAVVKWLLSVLHVTSWKLKAWLTEAAFPGLRISLPLWSCKEAKGWWGFLFLERQPSGKRKLCWPWAPRTVFLGTY